MASEQQHGGRSAEAMGGHGGRVAGDALTGGVGGVGPRGREVAGEEERPRPRQGGGALTNTLTHIHTHTQASQMYTLIGTPDTHAYTHLDTCVL